MDKSEPTGAQSGSTAARRRVSEDTPLSIVRAGPRETKRGSGLDLFQHLFTTVPVTNKTSFLQSSGPRFEGLMNQKRSNDPEQVARRASLSDQKPQAGFIGQMWNKLVIP